MKLKINYPKWALLEISDKMNAKDKKKWIMQNSNLFPISLFILQVIFPEKFFYTTCISI